MLQSLSSHITTGESTDDIINKERAASSIEAKCLQNKCVKKYFPHVQNPQTLQMSSFLNQPLGSSNISEDVEQILPDSRIEAEYVNNELGDKEDYFPHIAQSPRSLHISSGLVQQLGSSNVSEDAERILKYQYYIEAGIDENFIAPIREIWIKNALHHVGKHAIEGLSHETISHTLQQVSEEVHHEYILSMRKSIVNYILQVSALSILI